MGYRQVTKEELDDYISRNPGAKYRVNGQELSAPIGDEGQSGIMRLLTSLSKPLRTVPGSVYSAITGDTQGDNPFLTKREELSYAEDPTKFGTKAAAGLGSYLIPGGSTAGTAGARIAGAAAKGAGAGALGGFSMSGNESEDELRNILKGAGLGGLLGGGMQAAGEGVRALKNIKPKTQPTGELSRAQKYLAKQRGEAIGLDPNKLAKGRGTGINSATEGNKTIEGFFNSMDELGLPTRTSNIASESADKALSIYGDNFNKLLASADDSTMFNAVDTKNILDRITKEVGNNPNVMKASTVKELTADLAGLGNSYTPSQLNAIREKARGMINWSRSGNKMPMTERGVKSIFDSIDDFFKASIPESGETLSKMSNIYTVRPYIQGKAQLGDVFKLGTASTNIGVPTAGVNEAIQSGVGKLAQGVKPSGGADLGAIQGLLGTAGQAAQRVAPAMAGQLAAQPQQAQAMPQQGQMQQPQQDQQSQALQYALADAIYSGQISATEAEAIMGLLGLGEVGGNEDKSLLSNAVDQMERLYGVGTSESLSAGRKTTGLIGAGAKGLQSLRGTFDQDFADRKTAYDQNKALALGIINKAREAGTLNEGEFEILMQNVPDEYTSETSAQSWFNNVRSLLLQ